MQIRFLLLALVTVVSVVQCQSPWQTPTVEITENDTVGYGFVDDASNIIQNEAHLAAFYEKLYLQRTQGGRKVNIVHIGDSHILGNYMTSAVRVRMQSQFGDAGRGLIFPYKLIKSNGPLDYLVSANSKWTGTNCARDLDEVTEYGISGFSAVCSDPDGAVTFRLRDTTASSTTSTFTKVTVFFRNNSACPPIIVEDETTHQEAVAVLEDEFSKTFYFDRPVMECTVKAAHTSGKKIFWLDGVSIDNEQAGIIYHSIGVNGAKFSDFARAKYFARQMKELTPDLVVFSFGTNEAQSPRSAAMLERQMDELSSQIVAQWPNAALLFTTPADSYLHGKGFNPNMADISAKIRQYALKNGYALWDLYAITGGENSAESWKVRGLMSRDSVHYSKSGYIVQGKLLYQGLIKGYNESVRNKLLQASGNK